ncbi:MAG TPA: hypothetical protein VFZ48_02500 [Candidatus Saccharimonadales bacterium]
MSTPKVDFILPAPRADKHHTDYILPQSFSPRQIDQIRRKLPQSFTLEETGQQLVCKTERPDCIFGDDYPVLSILQALFLKPGATAFTAVVHEVRKTGKSFRVSLTFLGRPHPQDMMHAGTLLSRIEGVSDQSAFTSSYTLSFLVDGSPERSMNALLNRMQKAGIGAALL